MSAGRKAALIAIGDELLAGAHPDLNSPALARGLAELGWQVERVAVLGDDQEDLAGTMAALCAGHDLVVASGGLGPTLDDVTRHAAAQAADKDLVMSQEALAQVSAWFQESGREMPPSNDRQALMPAGAEILPNPAGTAPGFRVQVGGSWLVVLPGPPRELVAMWEAELAPWLRSDLGSDELRLVRRFHLVGLSESVFAERAGDWMERGAEPLMGVTVAGGVMSVRMVARGSDRAALEALLDQRCAEFRERFGAFVFSEEEADPAKVLVRRLLELDLTFCAAESCTAGRLVAAMGVEPGLSGAVERSFVTYSNQAKHELLGVPSDLLEGHGAVSEPVVRAMAEGAAERAPARVTVAISGVAGPDGGSEEKPVGLVWFAVHIDGQTQAQERRFPAGAGRAKIQQWATVYALGFCLQALAERYPPS